MIVNNIGNQINSTLSLSGDKAVSKENKLSFENMLNTVSSIEANQVNTKASVYNMLTTGEGDTHEAMIAMQKAASQIKTASVVRDKFLESYNAIMNMQI
ncbi:MULTISPECIES: flagellar hook-basal body complex protein FliE [Bacillus cereus group]|uniref:Flagellar hook-basal body complex protein FliE n=2 Tax=Bacillus cereus group TaxID=86661 RepID=A0A9X6SSA6_BACCE|nr:MULTISPECIES: flagellar hook-basal body complex protein FliE [Bacillus cereus group]MDA1674901.1 flagellar hook-basal body complex protein FliE [Bacillus cereus group sp. TH152-1LC]PDZ94273.1 hypothetical protein CON36_34685 [Bacillus cereus]PFJ31018.1 hypothetical protein COJ15_30255 [Bacillus thuringiensis]PGP12822.1 hypothetical protein COA01_33950 [Bacillus cereus]